MDTSPRKKLPEPTISSGRCGRFRRKSGETVGRGIEAMRTLVEQHGAFAVLEAGARTIPRHVRPAAFALAADLVLADGKIPTIAIVATSIRAR